MTVKAKADAIDRFVRTLKSSGLYDDIGAACIMAGWTNLAGALTPLKGAAPTNGGGLFQDADLDPGIGLKGDGSTKYLDSNRAANAAPQDDTHGSVFVSSKPTSYGKIYFGNSNGNTYGSYPANANVMQLAANHLSGTVNVTATGIGDSISLVAVSRSSSSSVSYIAGTHAGAAASVSASPLAEPFGVFARSTGAFPTDATLSWYSFGSATDLAALDSAVSTLMSDLRAIDEDGFDRDALAYIRNVEAADGSFLETGVKQAINRFIVGCKKDGIWNAIRSSAILCGARTISGAFVPLAGGQLTGQGGFVSGDYNRKTGLLGKSGSYVQTPLAVADIPQNDNHQSAYISTLATDVNTSPWTLGVLPNLRLQNYYGAYYVINYASGGYSVGTAVAGFAGSKRTGTTSAQFRNNATNTSYSTASETPVASSLQFLANGNNRMAFFSAGTATGLALLDTRVTTLVSQIAAAIP